MAWRILADTTLGDFTAAPDPSWRTLAQVGIGDFTEPPSWRELAAVDIGDFQAPPSWRILADVTLGDFSRAAAFRPVYTHGTAIAAVSTTPTGNLDLYHFSSRRGITPLLQGRTGLAAQVDSALSYTYRGESRQGRIVLAIPRSTASGWQDGTFVRGSILETRAIGFERVPFVGLVVNSGSSVAEVVEHVFGLDVSLGDRGSLYRRDISVGVLARPPYFKPVYRHGEYVPGFEPVYRHGAPVADFFRPIYRHGERVVFFNAVYRHGEAIAYVPTWRPIYRHGVAIASALGWKAVYLHGQFIEAPDPNFPIIDGDIDLGGGVMWRDVLSFVWRVGRSDGFWLSKSIPGQGLITLDNTHGRYHPDNFRPGQRVRLRVPGELEIGAGFISAVLPQTDHSSGLKTAIIRLEGALALLSHDEYSIALFETNAVGTSEIVESALDQAGWPQDLRRIDGPQQWLHPAHYTRILGSRALQKSLPVLQATETAELGFMHELRGSHVVFEGRYHREMDDRDGQFVFGGDSMDGSVIPIEGTVNPNNQWDNVYTAATIGAEKAVVLAPGKVWEMDDADDGVVGFQVPADNAVEFKVDLTNQPDFRTQRTVESVASWSPILASHYEARRGNDPRAAVTNLVFEDIPGRTTRTARTIRVTNPNAAFSVVVTRLEIHGRGVGLHGDVTLPEITNEQAEALYHRRVLTLPASIVGDAINHKGSSLAESKDFILLALERFGQPRSASRIPYNPLGSPEARRAGQHMQISDPILVQGGYGLDAGAYYVEGHEFHYMSGGNRAGILDASVFVSQRGRRLQVVDETFAQPAPHPGGSWTTLHGDVNLGGSEETPRFYMIGVLAQLPDGVIAMEDDDECLRLVVDGEVRKVWHPIHLPKGEPDWLVGHVRVTEPTVVQMQVRVVSGITPVITRLRAVRVDG